MNVSTGTAARISAQLMVAATLLISSPGAGLASATPLPTTGILHESFTNGITATIYTADHLAGRTQFGGTRGTIMLDGGRYLTVVTDIDDPLISNKGDGEFHPFDTQDVIDLIRDVSFPDLKVSVDIYILPFPRTNMLVSSTSGRTIYLSPQVRVMSREGAAYVLAHELGHVFHNVYMPDGVARHWAEFRRVRGIEDTDRFSNTASHPYRPKEILAEDFRVLYGGPAAFFHGRVENPELVPPLDVAGLRSFFSEVRTANLTPVADDILSVHSYPNPFNPATELTIQLGSDFLASGKPVTVRIYDVRGRLVRELYTGLPLGPELRVRWDGLDAHGEVVATSTYFGVVHAGGTKATRKLLMIK